MKRDIHIKLSMDKKPKKVKVLVTLDTEIVKRMTERVSQNSELNQSRFVREVLRERLGIK